MVPFLVPPILFSWYGAFIAVRSSRTSYRFRSLHLFGLHKCRLPEKVANRVFTHSASHRCASFVHTLFAFTSGLAGSSTKKQSTLLCKHSQAVAPRISSVNSAAAFRFVSCLFPHAGQSWVKGKSLHPQKLKHQ